MNLRVLIIEDDRSMAILLHRMMDQIKKEFPRAEVDVVHNFEDAKRIIHGIPPPDIALLDLSIPPLRWYDTLERIHEIEGRCAIVIVTGHSPEEVAKRLGDKHIEMVHKSPGMMHLLFNSMYKALSAFQGDRLAAYEEQWDRIRALRHPLENGPQEH